MKRDSNGRFTKEKITPHDKGFFEGVSASFEVSTNIIEDIVKSYEKRLKKQKRRDFLFVLLGGATSIVVFILCRSFLN